MQSPIGQVFGKDLIQTLYVLGSLYIKNPDMIGNKFGLRILRVKFYIKIQNLIYLDYHKWETKTEAIESTQELYLKKLKEEQEKLNATR